LKRFSARAGLQWQTIFCRAARVDVEVEPQHHGLGFPNPINQLRLSLRPEP
jgi:hypothetical protein